MTFSSHGFEQVIIDFDSKYSSWFSEISDSKYTITFDLSKYFLTDRQSAKRMFTKRNADLLDVDANRSIYGSDIEKNKGAGYKIWDSDNDIIYPEIVKISETPDEDLDSPYQPLSTSSEVYERIDDIKRQLKSDSYNLEYLNLHTDDQLNRINELIKRLSQYATKSDIKNSSSSLIAIALLGMIENTLSIISNLKLNLEQSRIFYLNFKYLQFVVIPESLADVIGRFSAITDLLIAKEEYLKTTEDLIIGIKASIFEGIGSLIDLDNVIAEGESVLSKANIAGAVPDPTGAAGAAVAAAAVTFDEVKTETLNQKGNILTTLVQPLSKIPEFPKVELPPPTPPDLPPVG
jgi:hypothetical protein